VSQIVVGVADCRVASGPNETLTTYALGSCIGLAAFDPQAGVGGLLHFMLPDSAIDAARGREKPFMFADTGIPLLLHQAARLGASRRRLILLAAGGANMLETGAGLEIGKRNQEALRGALRKAGLRLHGEAVGGAKSRTMRLELGPGKLWLQEAGEQWELLAAVRGASGLPACSPAAS
jgi:chemotaxis protein CheD